MAFWAYTFTFDGVPSEKYSMVISSPDGEESVTSASTNIDIKLQEVYRRPVPYFYGVQQTPVLEFPVSIRTTETELTIEDSAEIQKWLFGQMTYKKLRIMQSDIEGFYFNCFLVDPQVVRSGNIIRGFDCTVRCDSPFAWGNPVSLNYVLTSPTSVTEVTESSATFTITNTSENLYFTFPKITVKTNNGTVPAEQRYGGTSYFKVRNKTDLLSNLAIGDDETTGRLMQFGGTFNGEILQNVLQQETIEVDSDLQIISSNLFARRLPAFNKHFFRLLSGKNVIAFSGYIDEVTIEYTPFKRIG